MRHIVFFVLILSLLQMSFGQISGSLSDTLGPGTFHVSDTIYVDAGDSLRLMPATTFIFDGPYPFKIEGTLLAEGTETDSIIFTTDTVANPDRWRGLRFFNSTSSGSRLSHCLIEKARAIGPNWRDNYGAVLCDSSSPGFEHCTIRQNDAVLQTWYALGGGICCRDSSSAHFTACVIRDNRADYGGGVYFNHSQPVFINCLITGNSTSRYGGGTCGTYSSTSFIHCTFHENSNGAGWTDRGCGIDCEHCSLTVRSSIIAFSDGAGIHFWDCTESSIEYCDFYGSSGGNIAFSSGDPANGPPSLGVLSTTNVNGDSCDTYLNIFRGPLFEDAVAGDFHLRDDSRCIGAADSVAAPVSDFEGNPRPNPPGSWPDIGALENEHDTPVFPGGLSGELSGTLGPGHFYIVDSIYVNSGDSLRLQPGTTFDFYGPYPFRVEGTLLAEGTETDSIIFTTDAGANPLLWRGLRFYNSSSSGSRLSYCLVENSKATGVDYERYGGCVYCTYSSPSFSHCLFRNSSAQWGGGIACWYASPTFAGCVFFGNISSTYGGGMYGWYSSPTFTNCVFSMNSAQFGGAACCSGMSPTFTHCTFYGNSASISCGGVYCSNSFPSVISSIITNSVGTGLFFWNASSSQIRHCDLFNNSAGAIGFSGGNPSNGPAGIGQIATVNANGDSTDTYYNIFLHPGFLDSAAGDFHLADTSHCIGAAQISGTDEDFDGNPRPNPAGSRPDIGAFENANGTLPPSGLAGSLSGILGPGIYTIVDTIYVDAEDSLRLLPGTFFYFYDPYPFIIHGTLLAEGIETDSIIFAPDPVANPFGWRGLRFLGSSSSGSRLAYCLIKDGRATGTSLESKRGGGVYCESSSPNFSHCDFQNNWAESQGGGVACWYATPTLDKCSFISNSATSFGGGYYSWYSNSELTNCVFRDDSAQFGGGACCSGGTPTLLHCTFVGNIASVHGSGIYCSNSSPIVTNTLVAYSNEYGIYFYNGSASQIEYCDFFNNADGDFGFSSGDPSHGPTDIGELFMTNTNGDSCDTYFNIFLNPMVVDSTNDFHLTDSSHCISAAIVSTLDEDFDGNLRPNPPGSPPDIGAFENALGVISPYSLSGNLSGTLGPGTYHVIDSIYILESDSLRILPGTTFFFDGAYPFTIQGTLDAQGTESDSIIFTNFSLLNPDGWPGLRFLGSTRSESHLEYCRIENGEAAGNDDDQYGGGVYCNQASPIFLHCDFVSNGAIWGGGAACWEASPTFTSCIFRDNEASDYGGGVYCWDSSPIFTNCIFSGNSSLNGGAISVAGNSPSFLHCTIIENEATSHGGGVFCVGSAPVFNSSIIAFSEGNGIYFWNSDASQFTYCDIYGNNNGDIAFADDDSSNGPAGIGVISQLNANGDASDVFYNIFLHPLIESLAGHDFRLTENSPCIGAGESGGPADDFEGNPRPNPGGSLPDIGAYENELAAPVPYEGLVGALSGILGPGVFHVIGEIMVNSIDSLRLMPGTTFIFDGPFPFEILGTLLAEGTESDSVVFTTDTSANPGRWRGLRFLESVRSGSRLAYCLIEHGRATGSDDERNGGGAYFDYVSPVITHCVFRNNSAELWGGGVACWYASPTFTYCTFSNNVSDTYGGGIYCWYSSGEFARCVFENNMALHGGGASCSEISPNFTRCTFSGNSASGSGGGLYASHCSLILNSSIVTFSTGAGIYFWSSSGGQVEYCDFFENSAGAFAFSSNDSSNGPSHIGQLSQENANGDSSDAYLNIFLDPLFADTAAGDFRILETSPCIDAGDPSLSSDPDGTIADIGAFYYHYGNTPPSPFSLISPSFGDTCWTLDTLLVWHAAIDSDTGDTVTYEIWLDTLANLSTAWEVDSELSDTSYALVNLPDDHSYYWSVHASDLHSSGTWANDTLMFHAYLPEPPDSFYLATPSDGDTVFTMTPTLRWHRAFDPDPGDSVCYNLIWSYDLDFSDFEDTTLCDTNFTFPAGLLFNKTFRSELPTRISRHKGDSSGRLDEIEDDSTVYWKVQAIDEFGLTAWCEPETGWSFRVYIEEAPNAFDLTSPMNGDTLDTLQAEFVWQEATDPDPGDSIAFYRIYLSLDSNFTTDLDSQQVIDIEFVWENFEDDQTYWWRVKAFDTHGNSTLSNQSWSFHTYYPEPPNTFSLATPQNGDTVFVETPTLKWYKASDPDPGDTICYRLFWSYMGDFSVYEDTIVCDTTFTFPVGMLFNTRFGEGFPERIYRDGKPTNEGLDNVEEDSTIYWKVRAIDKFGLMTWCEPEAGWNFLVYIEQPPNAFSLISPVNNDTLDTLAARFIWAEGIDPDPGDSVILYRVYLALDSNFTTELDSQEASGTELLWEPLADDQTYWWRVRAFDTHGNSTPSNQSWSFHTYYAEPPNAFSLASPHNGDTVHTLTPTLRWYEASDPDPNDVVCYKLLWSYDSDFGSYEDTVLCDTSFTFPESMLLNRDFGTSAWFSRLQRVSSGNLDDVEDDSTVYWKVQAIDNFGLTRWCTPEEGWRFYVHIEQPPNAFNLVAPVNGDTLDTLVAELAWEAGSDPDLGDSIAFYRVYLALDSNFTTELDSQEVLGTELLWESLRDDYTYWWRVKAFDTHGNNTPSNQSWSFQIYYKEPPDIFNLATPQNGDTVSTETPTLKWYKASDPDPGDTICYRLFWSYTGNFSVSEDTLLCDTTFTFPIGVLFNTDFGGGFPERMYRDGKPTNEGLDNVEEDSTLYWKVQAIDRFGLTTWCEPATGWSFRVYIEEPPNSFILISPTNGDTLDSLSAALAWEQSSDPDPGDSIALYRIYLALDSNFTAVLDSQQVTLAEMIWNNLEDDQTYWWRVKAFDTHGNSTLSNQSWNFHTYYAEPPDIFSLAVPHDGDTVHTLTPTLRWYEASDPDPEDLVCYELLWSYNSGFSFFEDTTLCDTSFTFPMNTLFRAGSTGSHPLRASRQKMPSFTGLDEVEDDSTVYWKVRAIDRFGLTTWCEPESGWNFFVYIEQPPDRFDLISPANHDTLDSLVADFIWEMGSDPDWGDSIAFHRVYLALDSNFTTELDSQEVLGTEWRWESLRDDQAYWWRVKAFDTHGNGTFSDQRWTFQTYFCEIPSPFSLIEPADGSHLPAGDIDFCWQMTQDPDPDDHAAYTVYMETPDTSFSYEADSDTCTSIDISILGLSDSVLVEWWVEAHSLCPDTIVGSLAHFHFYPPSEHPPSAFNLISPAWGDTCWTLDMLLVWEEALDFDSGDTVRYEVFLDTLSELSTAWEIAFGLSDTSFTLEGLLDDHPYYWTVHASDLNTSGTWANDTSMFRTYSPESPRDFALLEPEDNSQLPFGEVDFCWQTSQDPDPGDIVAYTMYFQSSDTSLTVTVGSDTCHTLDVGGLGLTDSLVVEWWIEAHSSYPDTTIESTTRFHFYPPSAAENEATLIPAEFALHQNWPNPFNPTTQIRFDLKEAGFVNLRIYNLMGQEISSLVSSMKTAGTYTVTFNANNLPSGIYLYRLEVNDFVSQKKMLLVK